MKRCIYCLKTEEKTSFKKREHVIPQFLGVFEPNTLLFDKEIVCDNCNALFSVYETIMKDDSLEGYYSAIWLRKKKSSIPLRGKRLKLKVSTEKGDLGDFRNMIPFMEYKNGKVYPRPAVGLKNSSGNYQGFLVEELDKHFRNKNKKFKKILERINKLDKSGILIYSSSEWSIARIVELLKHYGIKSYKEKVRKNLGGKGYGNYIELYFEAKIEEDIKRVVIKTAFNYFIYCSKESGNVKLAYNEDFNILRDFLLGKRKKYPINVKEGSSMHKERIDSLSKGKYHFVSFRREGNVIMGYVSFFGLLTYKFPIGPYNLKLEYPGFGCATFFDPTTKKILDGSPSNGIIIFRENKFGLFNL